MGMAAIVGWIFMLLQLLSAVHRSCSWTPVRAQYSLANGYLNAAQRPLWILEDELMKRQRLDRTDREREREYGRFRQNREMQQPPPLRIVVRPDAAPPPPPRMMPQHFQRHPFRRQPRTELRRRQPQSLPIFDNAPGDNALSSTSYPIFVYNGTKGELLLNTMLSAQRYPMQEPVPGQILYPPSTPMFRPKPIVERFRLPDQRELLNLTLIPFYAHEAITTAPLTTVATLATEPASYSTTTVTPATIATEFTPTTVTAAAASSNIIDTVDTASAPVPPYRTTPLPKPYETQLPRSKRRRNPKKAKQYNAYHSPQEVVQRQPTLRASPALTAPNNHRHHLADSNDISDNPTEELLNTETEELQLELEDQPQVEETTSADVSSLQIVYMDESLESPTDTLSSTTVLPTLQRQSSRYSMKREYFAFPVYTLGKLLQHPPTDSGKIKMGHIVELNDSSEHGETWFILNSRYKGPHRKSQSKYFTSKYVQNPKGSGR